MNDAADDVTEQKGDEASSPDSAPEKRKTRLWKKLVLALSSLALTLLALEVAARLSMPSFGPVKVHEGYYTNALPLITGEGGRPIELKYLPEGERLEQDKPEGELRVFVVGESSVEGSPLDTHASMPAMLYDELHARLPDRRFTVVNMGRSSSVSANTYYYLLYIGRYEPDYVVFYMGMNDADGMPGEQCAPVRSPGVHAVWRAIIPHLWSVWLTRVFGPQLLWEMTDREDWYPPKDCPEPSFPLWTDILVETAKEAGASVVIATPVISAATVLESADYAERQVNVLPEMDADYLGLLRCELEEGCDFSGKLLETLGMTPEAREICANATEGGQAAAACAAAKLLGGETLLDRHEETVERRASAWHASADKLGAQVIDFHTILREHSPHHLLAERYFSDRQHLLPLGYRYLAALVAARIESEVTGEALRPVEPPTDEEARRYVERSSHSPVEIALEQLVRGWYLTGAPGLLYTVAVYTRELCESKGICDELDSGRVALGWLRKRAGLPHGLPPELAKRLESFTPLTYFHTVRERARE